MAGGGGNSEGGGDIVGWMGCSRIRTGLGDRVGLLGEWLWTLGTELLVCRGVCCQGARISRYRTDRSGLCAVRAVC